MVILVKPDGTTVVENQIFGLGSFVGQIAVVAPTRTGATVELLITPPGGRIIEALYCAPMLSLEAEEVGIYLATITEAVTQVSGRATYQARFTYTDGRMELTPRGSFTIQPGEITLLPDAPDANVYAEIRSTLSSVIAKYTEVIVRLDDVENIARHTLTASLDRDTYELTITVRDKIGNIISREVIDMTVETSGLVDRAVTTEKLAYGAVTTDKIAPAAVTTNRLANGAASTAKLSDRAVTADKLGDAAVITRTIGMRAVMEQNLAGGAVTTDKIAPAAVTTDRLANGAASTEKLSDRAVTADKLGDAAVIARTIGAGAVTSEKMAAGAVTSEKVRTGAISYDKLSTALANRLLKLENQAFIDLSYDVATGVLTFTAVDGTTESVDLPLELITSGGYYDDTEGDEAIVLQLANGTEIRIPVDDMLRELIGYINTIHDRIYTLQKAPPISALADAMLLPSPTLGQIAALA